jgi:hypothetical protein
MQSVALRMTLVSLPLPQPAAINACGYAMMLNSLHW